MASPTYVTSAQTASNNATSLAPAKPPSLAVGNLMIQAAVWAASGITISPTSASWTNALGAGTMVSNPSATRTAALFWKFADASDVSAASFSMSESGSAANGVAFVSAYSFVDGSQPIQAVVSAGGASGTSQTSPIVTPYGPETRIVTVIFETTASGSTGTITDASLSNLTQVARNAVGGAIGDKAGPAGGSSSGADSISFSIAAEAIMFTLAIAPPAVVEAAQVQPYVYY